MRRRSRSESAPRNADRAFSLSGVALDPLSLAQRGRPGLYEFSVGLSPFGSRLSEHLPRNISVPSLSAIPKSRFCAGPISPRLAALQTDVHVGSSEADQR